MAITALVVSVAYLTWRALFTLGPLWISIPLLVLEVHATVSLSLFAFSLWDLRRPEAPVPATDGPGLRVAVLITTYDEPEEVLLPTVAGAMALPEAHRTLVLDDGNRGWVSDLCQRLGAQHVTRPDNTHAKAGNLNYTIEMLRDSVDVVAVLDADHVPTEQFLTQTLPYFADPDVALVQTPQEFYNTESFEHTTSHSVLWPSQRGRRHHEQAVFYRAVQSGKNRWNASFWCGTNAVLRLEALRSVGGVAVDSITEDILTTIRMHRRGWRTIYHNETLAHGLAARTIDEYQLQRFRWGSGAMQVLRRERPLTSPNLTLGQRMSYASSIFGWFDAWRTFGFLCWPLLSLLSGQLPIQGDMTTFAALYVTTSVLQRAAGAMLARGMAPQGFAMIFDIIRMPVNLRATATILGRGELRFKVTPKGQADRRRAEVPGLIVGLIAVSVLSLVWFGATLTGRTSLRYENVTALWITAAFATFNLVLLLIAAVRIRSIQFAGNRRRGERFALSAECRLEGRPVRLVDISLTGAAVLASVEQPVVNGHLELIVDGRAIPLPVVERVRRPVSPTGRVHIGLELQDPDVEHLALISTLLFQASQPTGADPEPGRAGPDGPIRTGSTGPPLRGRPAPPVSSGERSR
ncbi:MAG: glycosyltransferase [Actinomycetota bacterium]